MEWDSSLMSRLAELTVHSLAMIKPRSGARTFLVARRYTWKTALLEFDKCRIVFRPLVRIVRDYWARRRKKTLIRKFFLDIGTRSNASANRCTHNFLILNFAVKHVSSATSLKRLLVNLVGNNWQMVDIKIFVHRRNNFRFFYSYWSNIIRWKKRPTL